MSKNMLIGIGYRAGSGKDTVANYLRSNYAFKRAAFADRLKYVVVRLLDLNEWQEDEVFTREFKDELQDFGLTGGQILQRVGVALREAIPGCWIACAQIKSKLVYNHIVVTDVRFEDEAAHIKQLGGELWEVRRPVAHDTHVSETSGTKIQWDRVIHNTGTIADLNAEVARAFADAQRKHEARVHPAS